MADSSIVERLETKEVPFSPRLEGLFRTRFYEKAALLTDVQSTDTISKQEVEWVENECTTNTNQRIIYRASWFLLKDLVRAHWIPAFRDGKLMLRMPNLFEMLSKNPSEVTASSFHSPESKSFLRSWMENSRISRLQLSADFIRQMESPGGNKHSITELIADGEELMERLQRAHNGAISVRDAVKPYLQLVQENEKDRYTNLKLSDIWRYFRLTWSTPALTTPGRTMLYLIRDSAHPMHAIMGIASLENCALQINDRDNFIGWTIPALKEKLQSGEYAPKDLFKKLEDYLQDGINSIKWDELCTAQEISQPSERVVARLEEEARKASSDRKDALVGTSEDEDTNIQSELGQINLAAEKALYRRKRADQLSKYLSAKISFRNFHPNNLTDYLEFCDNEKTSVAVRTAFSAQKIKHIGSSMLELNVCGAVPPYNEILSGKLVALAAMTPQVARDYKARYGDKVSDIATRLKGEDVCREADLAFIGTTSLYFVGSSQYNRLKLPKKIFGRKVDAQWKELGTTSGYGTIQIGENTSKSLTEVLDVKAGFSHINHVFGEGASPKLRLLSRGLAEILETSSDETQQFMQHAMKRIVYGASLASNTSRYLLGYDSKLDYYTNFDTTEESTQRVIDYWSDRWLSSRLQYDPIYDRLKTFDKNNVLVSKYLTYTDSYLWKPISDFEIKKEPSSDVNMEFIRGFYRGKSSFADFIDDKNLNNIHVRTKLEEAILENLKSGKHIVLTGNAGDGKTHLIRILSKRLRSVKDNVVVELDASTLSYEQIYNNWKSADSNGGQYVIAINAAVLYGLYNYAKDKDFEPISSAFNLMCNSIVYRDYQNIKKDASVVLYDLSKRNALSQDILSEIINKLTNSRHYTECEGCPLSDACDVTRNRKLLQSALFQNRLQYVLDRVSLTGYHATLRELQSFVSYLIFGDRTCKDLSKTSGNNSMSLIELIYGNNHGKGALFDLINKVFDPAQISHPQWDEKILTGNYPESSWDEVFLAPNDSLDSNDVESFNVRKRQFYYFNREGSVITDILDDNLFRFKELISSEEKSQKKNLFRKLNYFFTGGCENPTSLNVWIGHRYDNVGRKVLLSVSALKLKDFEIQIPRLNPIMSDGIDYAADYILLTRSGRENISLKIDYEMFELLQGTERGIPVMFIETNLIKKVWRFMDQLQTSDDSDDDEMEFTIVDIQQKKMISVSIDTDAKQYTQITTTSLK